MKKQLNISWGQGIFIFYVFFVGLVVVAFVASRYSDHSLVVNDYYQEDLTYQSIYDKSQRALASDELTVSYAKENAEISIGLKEAKTVNGTLKFYRPSDASQDFNVDLTHFPIVIQTQGLARGRWVLKFDWSEDGTSFYQEKQITL